MIEILTERLSEIKIQEDLRREDVGIVPGGRV